VLRVKYSEYAGGPFRVVDTKEGNTVEMKRHKQVGIPATGDVESSERI
jgi:hypothetical protein